MNKLNDIPRSSNGLFIVPACPICGQAPKMIEGFDFERPDIRYKIQCPDPYHRPIYALGPTPALTVLGWYHAVEWYHYDEETAEKEGGMNPSRDVAKICIGVKEYEELRRAITGVVCYLEALRSIPGGKLGEWHHRPLPELDRLERAELKVATSAITIYTNPDLTTPQNVIKEE